MGTIFRHYGYRAAFTGKWHLDGSGYFGDGVPGGGFEPDWWFDGKRYAEALGPDRFRAYRLYRHLVGHGHFHHQYIPCIARDAQGRPQPFSLEACPWGDFLCRLFDACPWLEVCAGDCPRHRYGVSRDPRQISALCAGWKLFFAHTMPRFRRLADEIRAERRARHALASGAAGGAAAVGRNAPCPCGSGRKYKYCCGARQS